MPPCKNLQKFIKAEYLILHWKLWPVLWHLWVAQYEYFVATDMTIIEAIQMKNKGRGNSGPSYFLCHKLNSGLHLHTSTTSWGPLAVTLLEGHHGNIYLFFPL